MKHTVSSLVALSDAELDVTVAKLQGWKLEQTERTWYLVSPEEKHYSGVLKSHVGQDSEAAWLTTFKYDGNELPHPSTDANAALKLLDEILPLGAYAMRDYQFMPNSLAHTVPGHAATFIQLVEIRPSVAFPRMVTINFILHMQTLQS